MDNLCPTRITLTGAPGRPGLSAGEEQEQQEGDRRRDHQGAEAAEAVREEEEHPGTVAKHRQRRAIRSSGHAPQRDVACRARPTGGTPTDRAGLERLNARRHAGGTDLEAGSE